ncbi:WXG100 family type VII secretion target [Nocardia sp. NPDC004068]|uniref:WXG100 family type VII secretion target n=1 Tax=Nocardia sp. NPDC004068 TaxID=3364303 RepID=UPI0036CE6D14
MNDDTTASNDGKGGSAANSHVVGGEISEMDAAGREVMTTATAVKNRLIEADVTISALTREWRGRAAADFGNDWDRAYQEGLACLERLHKLGEFLRSAAGIFHQTENDAAAAFRNRYKVGDLGQPSRGEML